MKTTTRYSLIAFGIVIFLILAPLLILYVSGRTFNFDSRDTSTTGIFDAKSNPSGAKVYIDGKEHSSTPAIARFLNQGEYNITITKEGYYDWSKRLPIEAGQVTYAQVGVDEIQLVKKSQPLTLVPNGVSSFVLIDDTLWFARGNSLVHAPVNDPAKQTVIPLTFSPAAVTLLRNERHLYIGNGYLVDTTTDTAFKIPINFPDGTEVPENISVIPNNIVVYTNGNILNSYNPATAATTKLADNIDSFTMLGNTGYFIEKINASTHESKITTAIWDGTTFKDFQPLLSNIFVSGRLYITDNKELFCQCSGQLFRIGQKLELVNANVVSTRLDPFTNELSYISSAELGFYNFITSKTQLLTRVAGPTNAFLIRSNIGYGFIANSDGLEILEIDARDRQNRYQIFSGKPVYQIAVTKDQKTVIALQDGSLVMLDMRN